MSGETLRGEATLDGASIHYYSYTDKRITGEGERSAANRKGQERGYNRNQCGVERERGLLNYLLGLRRSGRKV